MRGKSSSAMATPGEREVKDIRRSTRRQFSAEEKIRIALDGAKTRSPRCAGRSHGLSSAESPGPDHRLGLRGDQGGRSLLHPDNNSPQGDVANRPHLLRDHQLGLDVPVDDPRRLLALTLALTASGCDQAHARHKPRLLSDNWSSYISGDLAEWLGEQRMTHVRGAPYHPQTQGKIER